VRRIGTPIAEGRFIDLPATQAQPNWHVPPSKASAILLEAIRANIPQDTDNILRGDSGLRAIDYAVQFLADILGAPIGRLKVLKTTELRVAWLAGSPAGFCPNKAKFAKS
jgi:glycerol kinase